MRSPWDCTSRSLHRGEACHQLQDPAAPPECQVLPRLCQEPSAASHAVLSPFPSSPSQWGWPAIRHGVTRWWHAETSVFLPTRLPHYYSSADTAHLTMAQRFTRVCPPTPPNEDENESKNMFLFYCELMSIIPMSLNTSSGRMNLLICKCQATLNTQEVTFSLSPAHCIQTMRENISTASPRTTDFLHVFIHSFMKSCTMLRLPHRHFTRCVIVYSKWEISKRK